MSKSRKADAVKAPSHYCYGSIEVIDAILDWGLDFCLGGAVKYIARAGRKPGEPLEKDIRKAIRILELYLANLEAKQRRAKALE